MLTGLELTFMGVTQCNSGLFSPPVFYCLTCGKKRKGAGGEGKEGKGEQKRKGRKEEGIKKDRRQDKKEF